MYIIAPAVPILNMAVINTLFILQVKPTTSNLISLVKLLMLSIWFNVAYVIYNTVEKLIVASKTVLMNTDELYSTLLVITSILSAVSEQFLTSNHSDNHMLLIPIEKLKKGRDSFRKASEAHLIHKAKTIEPLDINKRDEL